MSAMYPRNKPNPFNVIRLGYLTFDCECANCCMTKNAIRFKLSREQRMRWTRGMSFVIALMQHLYERNIDYIYIGRQLRWWHSEEVIIPWHVPGFRFDAGLVIMRFMKRMKYHRHYILRRLLRLTCTPPDGPPPWGHRNQYPLRAFLHFEIGRERVEYVCCHSRVACRIRACKMADARQLCYTEHLYLAQKLEEERMPQGLENAIVKYLY